MTIYNCAGDIKLPTNDGVMVQWETGKVMILRGKEIKETTSREFHEKDRAKAEEFLRHLLENGHPEAKMYDCFF